MGLRSRIRKIRKTQATPTTADGRVVVSSARARYVRCSPRKLALVANALRNQTVGEALDTLRFVQKPSAVPHLERTLRSAVANAENVSPEPYELIIGEIRVETAPMMKRMRAASFGRAVRVRKRMSHLTIMLTEN